MAFCVERVFTPRTVEYCGLPPVHPFEALLITQHIEHQHLDPAAEQTNSLCEQFFHILQREFFTQALRKRFHQSVATLQADLDAFVETYNAERINPETDAERSPAASRIPGRRRTLKSSAISQEMHFPVDARTVCDIGLA